MLSRHVNPRRTSGGDHLACPDSLSARPVTMRGWKPPVTRPAPTDATITSTPA